MKAVQQQVMKRLDDLVLAREAFDEVVARTRRARESRTAKKAMASTAAVDPQESLLSFMVAQSLGRELDQPRPAVFKDASGGLLRVVHREIVVRFRKGTPPAVQQRILAEAGFEERSRSAFAPLQLIVIDKAKRRYGADLFGVVERWRKVEEVVFATPNFVSEYKKRAVKTGVPRPEQWHLGLVHAEQAWAVTGSSGRGRGIVVAVIDDGVDVDHPALVGRIAAGGRDFFLRDKDPGFKDPRPKVFEAPYDITDTNDIHGTCCAGVVAAGGLHGVFGVAPLAKVLPIKIFHGKQLAQDARVADAIRYAALHADILSCSWDAPNSDDVRLALEDAGLGRGGKGAAIFCATGNESAQRIGFPAKSRHVIAVGASTDTEAHASYSNSGPEISVVAPSSGGTREIFTTDISKKARGYNHGDNAKGGKSGLYANDFGGTSSATPLAAGIGALVLAHNPALARADLKQLLEATATKIAGQTGHTNHLGHGRVDALAAVSRAVVAAPKKTPKKKKKKKKS